MVSVTQPGHKKRSPTDARRGFSRSSARCGPASGRRPPVHCVPPMLGVADDEHIVYPPVSVIVDELGNLHSIHQDDERCTAPAFAVPLTVQRS